MNDDSVKLTHEEWGVFALRWILFILIALVFYLITDPANRSEITGSIVVVLFMGAVLNSVFYVVAHYPGFRKAVPLTIILGDWLLLSLHIGQRFEHEVLLLGLGVGLMLTAALVLHYLSSLIHVIGLVILTALGLSAFLGYEDLAPFVPTLVVLSGFALMAVGLCYVRQRMSAAQLDTIDRLTRRANSIVQTMRDRNRVVAEMAVTLSANLNPDRVLEVALDSGALGIKPSRRDSVVSAALLFREDGALHVANSRGFIRSDLANVIPGQAGVVGTSLKRCEPIFGKDAKRDAELQYFASFQQARSLLCIPLHANYDNFGVLIYGSKDPDAFNRDDTDLLMAIGTQTTIALHNAVLYRNLLDEKQRIVEVEEDARKKLARDLHDGPTQNVSAIAMRMSYIYRLLERRPEEVPTELKKVEELARKTTREIRDMLFTLRPLVLESQGLEAALEQLCQKTIETHGQQVVSRVGKDVEPVLDSHQQGVIFYIVEEAVGNARKSAEAELISVEITRRGDVVVVEVSDNGVGFDTDAVNANYDQRGSLGMINMRERTALLDGTLRIDSQEGHGTTVTVVVPIKKNDGLSLQSSNSRRSPVEKQPATLDNRPR